jgi:hypothetical protein
MRITAYSGWLMIAIGGVIGIGALAAGYPAYGGGMFLALAGSGAFMVWLSAGWDRPLENSAELYKYGRPANATVVSVADEQLSPDGTRTAKVTLRVTPVNEPAYKTTRVLALPGGRVPFAGEQLTVKFDPQSRKNIVLLAENYQVEDGTTAMLRSFGQAVT